MHTLLKSYYRTCSNSLFRAQCLALTLDLNEGTNKSYSDSRKIKVTKLRGLGGKLGDSVEDELKCKTLFDLSQLTMKDIRTHFDEKTR